MRRDAAEHPEPGRLNNEPRLRNFTLRLSGKIGSLARRRYDLPPIHEPGTNVIQIEPIDPADAPDRLLTTYIKSIDQPLVADNVAPTGKPQIVHVPESSKPPNLDLN